MKRHIIEFVGTFFVVLAISLTKNPLAIGLIYLALLYIGARVSGAHYNPGITLALWLRGEFATRRIAGYWASQALGAFAALLFAYKLTGVLFLLDAASGEQTAYIGALELLLSFVLGYVFLVTRTIKLIRDTHLYGIILGCTLVGLTAFGGLINGAVAVASLVLQAIYTESSAVGTLQNFFVYALAPLMGAIAAGAAFDFLEVPAEGEFVGVEGAKNK